VRWKKPSSPTTPATGALAVPRSSIARYQEWAVYLLVFGTLALVLSTSQLSAWSVYACLLVVLGRMLGFHLSTNAGCVFLVLVAGAAPLYWFFYRGMDLFSLKDFLLAVLMVFLLSARTGRDYATVSVYCIWIMMASLFPSSGPLQWFLLAGLFMGFLIVQCLNEIRRCREQDSSQPRPETQALDGPRLLRPLAGFALVLLLAIGVFSATLYIVFPRNALSALHFNFQPPRRLLGFSNSIRLGQIGEIQDDGTPAFRVRFLKGQAPPVLRWRGAALPDFSGSAWSNNREVWSEFSLDNKVNLASDEQRRLPGPRLYFEVQSLASMDRVLFSTGVPEYLFMPIGRLRTNGEGALRQITLENTLPNYSLSAQMPAPFDPHPRSSDLSYTLPRERRARYLRLPPLSDRVRNFAKLLVAPDTDPFSAAVTLETHLRNNFTYSTKSDISGSEPLSDFLFISQSGHCEYFASALAVMLRSINIPSRVVTGFYGRLPEPVGEWYVIRSSNAHSWVEAWIEGRGWVVFDPTPPGSVESKLSPFTLWLQRLQDRAIVMGEDWFGGNTGSLRPTLPRPKLPQFQPDARYLWLPAGAALLYALYRWRPRPTDKPREATRLYKRFLKRAKIQPAPGQTAREIAAQMSAKPLAQEILTRYEEARFARRPGALEDLKRLIAQFDKQVL
jgi:protein-glutamine gamma-glutamyltransferase